MKLFLFIFTSLYLWACHPLWARPEYALKTTTVNCNACHLNPFGSGARTIFGKTYGSFGLKLAPYSKQDLFSADFRAVGYLPQTKKVLTSGFLPMNVQGTLNAPLSTLVSDDMEDVTPSNLVINFNLSEMNTSPGETFLLVAPTEKIQILLGQFVKPFGLLTDEHRTFVRMQTKTTLMDLESGVGMAHQLFDTLHIDLSYTNNTLPSSRFNSEPTWNKLVNLRWTPYSLPIMVGASTSSTERPSKPDSYAQSIYGGISFDRATDFKVPVTFLLEASRAKGWTAEMTPYTSYFMNTSTDAAFYNSVIKKTSLGFYGQLIWNLSQRMSVLYKFDQLLLDEKYPADAFERHGFGVNYNINSNLIFQVRAEYAQNGRKDLDQTTRSAIDTLFFVLRAWM